MASAFLLRCGQQYGAGKYGISIATVSGGGWRTRMRFWREIFVFFREIKVSDRGFRYGTFRSWFYLLLESASGCIYCCLWYGGKGEGAKIAINADSAFFYRQQHHFFSFCSDLLNFSWGSDKRWNPHFFVEPRECLASREVWKGWLLFCWENLSSNKASVDTPRNWDV